MADRPSRPSPLRPSDSISRYYSRHKDLITAPQESDNDTLSDREEEYEMLYEPPYEFNYWGVVGALNKISIIENTAIYREQPTSTGPAAPSQATTTTASSSLPKPSTYLARPTFQRDRSLSSTSTATVSSVSSSHTTTDTHHDRHSITSIFESPTPQSFLSPLDRITSIAMSSMILDPPTTTPTPPRREQKSRRG